MATKRGGRRKPVPAILSTPIEYSLLEEEKATSPAISRQIKVRLRAVFEYYGIDQVAPSGSAKLIELMARDLFPAAFRRVLRGTPKTKQPKWDVFQRNFLVRIMDALQFEGMSQEEAARYYIATCCPHRSSCKGIVAEYHRAKRWLREHKPTDLERRDFGIRMAEIQADIRRGK